MRYVQSSLGVEVEMVESIDDFTDERARRVAREEGLDSAEILPRYLHIMKKAEKVQNMEGEIRLDLDLSNPPASLEALSQYRKNFACGAVLGYELSKRSAIGFPLAQGVVVGVDDDSLRIAQVEMRGIMHRTAPVAVYESMGATYEQVMGELERPRRMLEALLPAPQ